jgi:hypothetical protein
MLLVKIVVKFKDKQKKIYFRLVAELNRAEAAAKNLERDTLYETIKQRVQRFVTV